MVFYEFLESLEESLANPSHRDYKLAFKQYLEHTKLPPVHAYSLKSSAAETRDPCFAKSTTMKGNSLDGAEYA